jgi:hypothetical protein
VSNQRARRASFGFMAKRATNDSKSNKPDLKPPRPVGTDIEQRIRERAYELYVRRGAQPGRAEEDWRLAEEEIRGITGGG